jgi:hypothetical protein
LLDFFFFDEPIVGDGVIGLVVGGSVCEGNGERIFFDLLDMLFFDEPIVGDGVIGLVVGESVCEGNGGRVFFDEFDFELFFFDDLELDLLCEISEGR